MSPPEQPTLSEIKAEKEQHISWDTDCNLFQFTSALEAVCIVYDEIQQDTLSHATPFIRQDLDYKLISIVILGLGVYGTELLKSLSWFGQMENYRLMLTAIDSRENAESVFSFQCPELMDEKHNGTYETGEAQYNSYYEPK